MSFAEVFLWLIVIANAELSALMAFIVWQFGFQTDNGAIIAGSLVAGIFCALCALVVRDARQTPESVLLERDTPHE